MPISERDRLLLDFESRWTVHDAVKEEAIRAELALAPARYYQLLARIIDQPDAAAHDAMLVHRLRRLRDARESERAGRAAVPAIRTGTGR
ncbi:DUF3263 domain-containing protein [Microbacterium sp. SCN 69-37]|uniref:DUF3263 domain-containing protein n=1 Tax=Microbacterium sp. SCN 69-37 TaxID=1660115 RepID=UPI00086DC2C1|nr:DUF3263 domain-containing protein [Microbacterium sp. SCN 69-37]ODT23965.1 MAG: hypothetical protein ABS64_08300 [Microbacterium sp. SCN 69-37]